MDIIKPKMDTGNPRMDIGKPDTDSKIGTIRDRSFYFVLAFVTCIVIFVFLGWRWAMKDNSTKTLEDNFKAELLRNPVKIAIPSASNQESQSTQSSASSQMMQGSASNEAQLNQDPATNLAGTQPQNIPPDTAETESTETKKFESTALKVNFDYPQDVSVSESGKIITITKADISWRIRFYDNKDKKDFQSWYTEHFDIKDVTKCTFTDATIKVGLYESKLVKPATGKDKCDGDGNYATSTDKSKVVKVELGKEMAENANKILTSFKFVE